MFGVSLGEPLETSGIPDCPEQEPVGTSKCIDRLSIHNPAHGKMAELRNSGFEASRGVTIFLEDGRVASVEMIVGHDDYPFLLKALQDRYGPAHKVSSDAVRTTAGAAFESRSSIWAGERTSIVTFERFERIDRSAVVFSDADLSKVRRQRNDSAAKDAAGKF